MLATYNIQDDKLRFAPAERLPDDVYQAVKRAGFLWAPGQKIFLNTWTPEREDMALALCVDIEDDTLTLEERAAIRSARFEGHGERAAERAEYAQAAVADIDTSAPVVCGHNDMRRARRQAEKTERALRRVADEMKLADYWQRRASAAVAHAEYKERRDVVARRVKKLEADLRKHERERKEAQAARVLWDKLGDAPERDKAMHIANYFHCNVDVGDGKDYWSAWSAMTDNKIEPAEARRQALEHFSSAEERERRWIEHIEIRLAYERALLDDKGGIITDIARPEVGGAVKVTDYRGLCYWLEILRVNKGAGGVVVSVTCKPKPGHWSSKQIIPIEKVTTMLSKKEYTELGKPQDAGYIEKKVEPVKHEEPAWKEYERAAESVTAVAANELFPTPAPVVAQMMSAAGAEPGMRVLEPSAGTGAILRELDKTGATVDFCEIDYNLARALESDERKAAGHDFMEYAPVVGYDRIVMNPPFSADVEHVKHAFELLASGGRIVAIMSESPFFNGNRRGETWRTWLDEVGGYSEKLPHDAFKSSGTGVQTRLVVIDKE